jgi:hypothetical protein
VGKRGVQGAWLCVSTPYLAYFQLHHGSTCTGSSIAVMVDAPRYTRRLGGAVARLGGVDYLVLVHATAAVGHEA